MAKVQHQFQGKMDCKTRNLSKKQLHTKNLLIQTQALPSLMHTEGILVVCVCESIRMGALFWLLPIFGEY